MTVVSIPQRRRYRNNPAERRRGNPCLPGERETAPSLGVRLVNAGRKREEKPVKSNRTTELAGQATMDKTTKGVLRCRYTCTDRRCGVQNQPNPDGRLAQKGTVSRSIRHNADGRSLRTRPGVKHRPKVARNGYAEQSNPL